MNAPTLPLWALVLAFPLGLIGEDRVKITWERKQLTDQFYAEGATFADLNKDGKTDVVAGPYVWLGPEFEKRIEFYPAKPFNINGYSDNFFPYTGDFDADGWNRHPRHWLSWQGGPLVPEPWNWRSALGDASRIGTGRQ